MNPFYAVALVLIATFCLSVAVEKVLGRSRKEMRNPGWLVVFFLAFLPASGLVYRVIPVENPLLYAAYGCAGGLAALLAQCFYGAKLKPSP
jgi:hypothetical protein